MWARLLAGIEPAIEFPCRTRTATQVDSVQRRETSLSPQANRRDLIKDFSQCRDGLWGQVLRFYRLVDVAKHLCSEAPAPRQEAPRHYGLSYRRKLNAGR